MTRGGGMPESSSVDSASATAASDQAVQKVEGLLVGTWRQFIRHPGAVAGSIMLILVVLASVFSYLSPYDPEKSDMEHRLEPPSWQHPMIRRPS